MAESDDLSLLVACAREAGQIARANFRQTVETWSKGAAGPVTEVDLAIDTLLKERLLSARPAYGWLSEETADNADRLSRERVFIVDPIDGTRAFIAGEPEFTISLAVVERGVAQTGVVYNPILDEMFTGSTTSPARINDAPITVRERDSLPGAKLLAPKLLLEDRRWPAPWPDLDLDWRQSIAYRLALTAAGRFEGAVMFGYKNEWDMAGGAAIMAAAGGLLSDMYGAPIAFNQPDPRAAGAVAAGAALHPLLIERLQHLPHPSVWERGGPGPDPDKKEAPRE